MIPLKKIALITTMLLAGLLVNSQGINKRVGFATGAAEVGFNVVENDSGYFMVGFTSTGTASIAVTQTDFNGTILFQKTYTNPNYPLIAGFQGSLVKLKNGGYAMYGGLSLGVKSVGLLYRFNELGDTLWTKEYGDTISFQTGRHMQQTLDRGFILIGDNSQSAARNWIIKTDSIGNIAWQQFYGGPQWETPTQIVVCSDGGYIFTAWTRSAGPGTPAKNNIRITKIDSLGNHEFTKIFGEMDDDYPGSISQTMDGGFIFAGSIVLDATGLRHPYVIRLNNLGDTLWTRTYPDPLAIGNGNDDFKRIIELPDGNFIAAGMQWDTDGVTFGRHDGLIIKLKPNGDTLWHRTYRVPGMVGNSTTFEIKDMRPTSDGGFICSGTVLPTSPDTGSQDMWLLKIDSNGCVDTSNCWVSVGIVDASTSLSISGVRLYPNPTNSIITIEIPNPQIYSGVFQLIDITGKEVLSKTINTAITQLDVGWLPKGLYFYRYVSNKHKSSHSGKLVIN